MAVNHAILVRFQSGEPEMYKGRTASLAQAITNAILKPVFFAIGLQLDEITKKLEDLEDEIKELKRRLPEPEDDE